MRVMVKARFTAWCHLMHRMNFVRGHRVWRIFTGAFITHHDHAIICECGEVFEYDPAGLDALLHIELGSFTLNGEQEWKPKWRAS